MRIWHSPAVGGPETLVLADAPDPTAGEREVVVEVAACGVNFPDGLIIRDLYQVRPQRPFAPGGEVAGIVSAVGAGVTGLVPGDRVIARTGWGAMAERIAVDADKCFVMPPSMSFEDGAALLFTYSTSYHALKQRGRLAAGETVLVLGAAGGTGAAALELARALGAGRIVAAVSTEEKAEFARSCGADEAIVYPTGDLDAQASKTLAARFKQAIGGTGADVVYDPVGGAYAEPALRTIAWRGRYLVVGFTAGIPAIPLNLPLLKGCEIVGVFNGGFQANEPETARRNSLELISLFEQGLVRPRVSKVYPFEDAPRAIEAIAARGVLGKVVVRVREDLAA
jgi:NADPH2:quinone reductase